MKDDILKLRESGKTYDEISKILDCSKSTISYHCSSEVRKASQIARLKNKRKSIVEIKRQFGSKCAICGYNKCLTSLVFHHENPDEKENTISRLLCAKGKKAALEESKKCILICSNCHGEIEEKKRGTYHEILEENSNHRAVKKEDTMRMKNDDLLIPMDYKYTNIKNNSKK